MMSVDERKKRILHAVIKDYVATAEPVGSRTLVKKYNLGVSPATIRNEMSDLEDLGYIRQPHASAGRVPSDKGYRFYVDNLMDKEPPLPKEVGYIRESLKHKIQEMDALFQQSCQLLSQFSHYTAIMVKPRIKKGSLARVSLIPVGENQVLLMLVNDSGMLFHRILEMAVPLDTPRLQQFETLLQQRLGGLDMQQVTRNLLQEISLSMSWHQNLMKQAVDLMDYALSQCSHEQILVNGTTNMFSQPEFKDVERVKNIMDALEGEGPLRQAFSGKAAEGTQVIIGDEIPDSLVNCCSMVKTTYKIKGEPAGTIGVLGPTRMDYSKAVALVELISEQLSEMLSQKK